MTTQKEMTGQVVPRTSRDLSPFEELDHLFDRLFEGGFLRPFDWRGPEMAGRRYFEGRLPRIDVIDREQEVVVRAEIPGMRKEDVEVAIANDLLTIKGKTHEEQEEKGEIYRSEIRQGSFTRSVRLPSEVKGDGAKAHFENGLLEITLPKAQEALHYRVTVD